MKTLDNHNHKVLLMQGDVKVLLSTLLDGWGMLVTGGRCPFINVRLWLLRVLVNKDILFLLRKLHTCKQCILITSTQLSALTSQRLLHDTSLSQIHASTFYLFIYFTSQLQLPFPLLSVPLLTHPTSIPTFQSMSLVSV